MADDQYKARMQRKKAHIDNRIEEANIDKGIIVLLTGNGKGKSSSALGYSLLAPAFISSSPSSRRRKSRVRSRMKSISAIPSGRRSGE
jgi:hypothetical protein